MNWCVKEENELVSDRYLTLNDQAFSYGKFVTMMISGMFRLS
jgi:hypothetical protein